MSVLTYKHRKCHNKMSWQYTAASYRGRYSRLVPWLLNLYLYHFSSAYDNFMYWNNPFSRYHWYYWMRFGMFPKFMRWLTDCLAPGVPHHHLPHISLIENSKISYLEIGLRKELHKSWFLIGIYFDKDNFYSKTD